MLKFFGKSYLIQYFALFLLGLVLWSPAIAGCVDLPKITQYNSAFDGLLNFISGWPLFSKVMIAYLLVYFLAAMVNSLAARYSLIEKNSLLVMAMFIVLSSLFTFNMTLGPALLGGFFTYLLIAGLFKHDLITDNIVLSFNTGIFAGMIGLLYYPAFFLFFFIWFSLRIIGGTSWRNIAASMLGVFLPLFGEYLFFFFSGEESHYLEKLSAAFQTTNELLSGLDSADKLYYLVVVASFMIIGFFAIYNPVKLAVKQRKFLSVLGLFSISMMVILLFFNQPDFIFVAFPAVAIILGNVFSTVADSKKLNILFLIVLIMILANNWINCF